SAAVLDLIEQSFGKWRALPNDLRATMEPVRVRILVHEGSENVGGHVPVAYISAADARLVIHSPGSVGIANPFRRESIAHVTSELVSDREHFRIAVLEAITFALLCCFDRHPIHAAAITNGERTVLLAGESGSGKSTLAY